MHLTRMLTAGIALLVLTPIVPAEITASLAPVSGGLSGYRTFDLQVTTGSGWTNSRLDLTLSAGTLYQDALGGHTAPNPALFGMFPSLEWDTFVTSADGYPNPGGTGQPSLVGTTVMTDQQMGVSWFSAAGAGAGTHTIARLTFSNTAQGQFTGMSFEPAAPGVKAWFTGTITTDGVTLINGLGDLDGDGAVEAQIGQALTVQDFDYTWEMWYYVEQFVDTPYGGVLQTLYSAPASSFSFTIPAEGEYYILQWDQSYDSESLSLATFTVVPEPASALLLMGGAAALWRRRVA